MNLLQLLFLPYLLLGLVTGGFLGEIRKGKSQSLRVWVTIAAIHLVLFGVGLILARKASARTSDDAPRFGISAGAFCMGLVLSYFGALVFGIFGL